MTKYKPTIGLEIHAELKTATKMFCGCKNDPLEKAPNKNICPICLAHPGTLPTANKKAVELMAAIGYALGGKIQDEAHFDRKSYFYPDLPKGYQISQYEHPFVKGGNLVGVDITRVHLEEDTARLAHDKSGSHIDFNRAVVPLMELVTEPVIKDADKALEFAKELQLILRYLGASDADMKGQMRAEANVSISPEGVMGLGTKVELKNINSFRAVRSAIAYELERQEKLLADGKKIVQETRGWNESKGETFSQRVKETADDYRYMPEPDLPPVIFTADDSIDLATIKDTLPELPSDKRRRFIEEYGFSDEADALDRLIRDKEEATFSEETASEINEWVSSLGDVSMKEINMSKNKSERDSLTNTAVNLIDSDLVGLMATEKIGWDELKITPENFAELVIKYRKGEITTRVMKDVLKEMLKTGVDPTTIIDESKLTPSTDRETAEAVEWATEENKKAVEDYKKGKEAALKFLVGQAMGRLRGRGNPELLEKLFRERLPK